MNLTGTHRAGLGAVLVLLGSLNAAAALDCDTAADQASLNECASMDYAAADTRLNETYKRIVARLSDLPEFRAALTKAQRAWITYRDAECAFATAAVAEGSAYPMIANYCLAGLTQARVQDLETYFNCEEGDLSCPVPSE
jgi:uncharacterized protein YecT (DUF1311 family)